MKGGFVFSLKTLKAHPELIPLVGIVACSMTGIVFFSGYQLWYNPEVRLKKRAVPRWELIDPEKPQKLMNINQEWKKIPELEKLLPIIGPYSKED